MRQKLKVRPISDDLRAGPSRAFDGEGALQLPTWDFWAAGRLDCHLEIEHELQPHGGAEESYLQRVGAGLWSAPCPMQRVNLVRA